MNNTTNEQTITIEQNRINLFYFFQQDINPEKIRLTDTSLPLPDSLQPALDNLQIKEAALWKKTDYAPSTDFLPNVRGLFKDCGHQAIATWKPDTRLLKLLNGSRRLGNSNDKTPLQLTQELSKSAKKRLNEAGITPEPPRLAIRNIHYHQFKTGFSVAVVDIQLVNKQLPSDLLLESLHALCRFNKLSWLEAPGAEENHATQADAANTKNESYFSLGQLVRGLLGETKHPKHTRVFSHCFLSLADPAEDDQVNRLLMYLSRHYTRDYHLGDDRGETRMMTDFNNVHHCIANEGCATATFIHDESPEFLRNYYSTAIQPAVLPICLLTFHAEHAIRQYMADTAIWLEKDKPVELDWEKIKMQKIALMNFDTHFFYPVISTINSHNRIHRTLLDIKRLEEQHDIVASTTKIMDLLITAHQEKESRMARQRRNKTICLFSAGGAFAVTYLTTLSIVNETLEVLNHEILPEASSFHEILSHHSGIIGLGFGLVAACFAGLFTRKKCLEETEETEETENKTLETAEILHLTHLLKKK